jgi:hypothetical protein
MLTFGGTFDHEQTPDGYYSFEGRNGQLTVQAHHDNEDWRDITADEVKAKIAKCTAKIEKLQGELTDWNSYLARHHSDQI